MSNKNYINLQTPTDDERVFLQESNYIEEEWGQQAYIDAVRAWYFIKNKRKLTLPLILTTHKILTEGLKHSSLDDDEWKGKLRNGDVMVGGEIKMPANEVPIAIRHWIGRVNATFDVHMPHEPILEALAKNDHIAFEDIHPFFDGNGRIGRILFNWERIHMGLSIQIIKYKTRRSYYNWFKAK